ncbi:MAG: glycerophosphodiester phosphodiesterase family protein [Pseudomonadota bacterium]
MRFHFALAAAALVACGPGATTAPTTISDGSPARIVPTAGVAAFFDCLRENDIAVVSAHRGGPADGFPENAIETMEDVLRAAPAIMEIDVAATADGVLVLMHDDDLDRTTTGTGPVADRPYEDVRSLRLEDNDGRPTSFTPPTLRDALRWSEDRTILQIDFKRSVRYEDVIQLVREERAESRVVYIAYTVAQARRLHRLAPNAVISVGIDDPSEYEQLAAMGFPSRLMLAWTGTDAPDAPLYDFLEERSVEAAFGTLGGRNSIDSQIARSGSDADYQRIADLGATVLATDRPRKAAAALSLNDVSECGISPAR